MARNHWRIGMLAVAASVALAACDMGSSGSGAVGEAKPGASSQKGTNTAPTIAGNPAVNATAGATYIFQPSAADTDSDTLSFSATGLPSWATLNAQSGTVSGTPATGNAGSVSTITISVSDGTSTASLPAFTLTVSTGTAAGAGNSPASNTPPVIGGSVPTLVQANALYSFTPSASDANGDALGFSITGKPAWATFSTATGALTGTPTTAQVGTFSNIVITVSDGKVSQALPAFAITVNAASSSGTATLSWTAPTQTTSGSQLTNLGGYKLYHGTSAAVLDDVRTVAANSGTYQFTALVAGTHYFAISAYNTAGEESSMVSVGSKVIP